MQVQERQAIRAGIASVNPAPGQIIRKFEQHSPEEVEYRLAKAREQFSTYSRTSFANRAAKMCKAADLLESDKEQLGRTMVVEMGKPIRAAVQEIEKCAWGCRYYAEHAERFLADETIPSGAHRSLIKFQPLGPVLA